MHHLRCPHEDGLILPAWYLGQEWALQRLGFLPTQLTLRRWSGTPPALLGCKGLHKVLGQKNQDENSFLFKGKECLWCYARHKQCQSSLRTTSVELTNI